jgi:serine protease
MRTTWALRTGVLAAVALLAGCNGKRGDETSAGGEASVTVTGALTEARRVNVVLPAGVEFTEVALGANGLLKIDDRAQVLTTTPGGFAPSTNAGLAPTALSQYGLDSKVGRVTSTAAVSLLDRSRVTGSVVSGRAVAQGAGVVVTGGITQNAVLTPVQTLSWNVQFELGTQDVSVPVNGSRVLAPGAYRNVTAFANATLTLNGAGTYYFNQLDLEPQARLVLSAPAGAAITVYVRSTLIHRGSMSGLPAENVLFVYLGTQPPAIESSFNATLVAPDATARLATGNGVHSGVVLARDIALDPGVNFTFRPYAKWDQIPFNVIPTLACVEQRPQDGKFAALLGYYNPNRAPVTVPVGAANRFTPNPQDHGQPRAFLPGRFTRDFGVDFGSAQSITWQLQGTSLAIARTATPCQRTTAASTTGDTTVAEASPRANFGTASTLTVAAGSHALVRFDRAALKQQVGNGRTVAKATLELTLTSGAKPPLEAFVMSKGRWTETGATWRCANDTAPGADDESCAAGLPWRMARGAALEAAEVPPWLARTPDRRVLGTWTGNKVSFDVTRDTWDLLGAEGFRRGMSFVVVAQPDATGTAQLGSLESAAKPTLRLEMTTLPDPTAGGHAPLSFTVDPTVAPSQPFLSVGSDGLPRPVVAVADARGHQADFVASELLVQVTSEAALAPIAARWGGTILSVSPPSARTPQNGLRARIRIDASRARADALVPRLRDFDNRPSGPHRVSGAVALATAAAAAEEALNGTRVSLNWLAEPAIPTDQQWADRDIHDGAPTPGFAFVPVPGDNPFAWPGFAACDPFEPDPLQNPGVIACGRTFPDGSAIGPKFTIAEAWRALALSGKLVPASVRVALVDIGWLEGDDEYPSHFVNDTMNPRGETVVTRLGAAALLHGDAMVRIGFAVAGDGKGSAGPGAPVVDLELLSTPFGDIGELADSIATARQTGSRLVSHSGSVAIMATYSVFAGVDTEEDGTDVPLFAAAGNRELNVDDEDCLDAGLLGGIGCWEEISVEPCENAGVLCVGGLDYNSEAAKLGHPGTGWGSKGSVDFATPWFNYVRADHNFNAVPVPPVGPLDVFASGTSGATAFMAGVATVVAAADPAASGTRIKECLFAGAKGIQLAGGPSRTPDALKSVRCMLGGNVAANVPAHIEILDPADGITVNAGQLVAVRARATDYEAGVLNVNWSSNIDGPLGQTASQQFGLVMFSTPGDHVLTASALGEHPGLPPWLIPPPPPPAQEPVSDSIIVHVLPAPFDVSITKPAADGQTFNQTSAVLFTATATTFGIGPLDPTTFTWQSVNNDDGTLDFSGDTGLSISKSFATAGSHTVTVTRFDPVTFETATATRQFNIASVAGNVVDIISPPIDPSMGVAVITSTSVILEASANFPVTQYSWSLFINSTGTQTFIGTGNAITWNPYNFVPHSCGVISGLLRLTVTGGGVNHFDSQPVAIYTNPNRIGSCVK